VRAVVIGASAGLGRALAGVLAEAGHHLVITSRDVTDLDATAADLNLRTDGRVTAVPLDLRDFDPVEYRSRVIAELHGIDALFVTAGYSTQDDRGQVPDDLLQGIVGSNFTGVISLINAFLGDLRSNRAHLVATGSVAAVRARGSNSVYGASKHGLEFYCEAVRHHLSDTKSTVCLYRLGYVKTNLNFGQNLMFPAMEPAAAARQMVKGLGRRQGIVYLPKWWRLIGLALKLVPWPLYRRLDF